MKVSIISPCWGHQDLGRQLYEGVKTTKGVDFELILVDNGDGVPDDLPKEKWLTVLKPGKNLGFGQGNNLGFKHSKGDIVCFINNDVIINSSDWLERLVKPLLENPKRLVGAQLVLHNDYTKVHGKNHPYINGWCMVMERELFEKTNGFDAGFGLGWFEDVYLSVQAVRMGYELFQVDTNLTHMGSQTIHDGRLETNKLMIKAGYYFRKKIIKDNVKKGKLRIVFLCAGNYKFSDGTWEGRGVGGAEASLILLSRELAKMGHSVAIYNNPEMLGTQNGVDYFPVEEFKYTDYADIFICFRNPIKGITQINAPVKIFWSCDQYTVGNFKKNVFPYYDKVICISEFHKKYFLDNYQADPNQIEVIDLGVNLPDYQTPVEKIPGRMIFCSVPHRGLDKLIELWPRIKQRIPNASLVTTSDYTLWGIDRAENEEFKEMASHYPDITFLGKVTHQELVKYQLEAEVMAYPCLYDENFCIAAAECMAAGAIPVYFARGAMKTTIGYGGLEAKNDAEFIDYLEELFKKPALMETVREVGKKMVKEKYDWATIATKWEKLLYSLEDMWNINLKFRLPEHYKNMSVLDLGCGKYESGISDQIPGLKFESYHGVDIWEKDMAVGSQRAFNTKDVSWENGDIVKFVEKELKAGGKWDIILLLDVIEHLPKKEAIKLLKNVEKLCKKRIIIFMPLGDHTLEANDGLVKESQNPYQQHLSEWNKEEWEDLGYDVELFEGFHHGGILDAAWIIKDTKFMKVCDICGTKYNSSYYLRRHAVIHGTPDSKTFELEGVPLAQEGSPESAKMPDIMVYLTRNIDISVGNVEAFNKSEIRVPYDQIADVLRILREAYGEGVVDRQEFL